MKSLSLKALIQALRGTLDHPAVDVDYTINVEGVDMADVLIDINPGRILLRFVNHSEKRKWDAEDRKLHKQREKESRQRQVTISNALNDQEGT